jgi:hypothetical protein
MMGIKIYVSQIRVRGMKKLSNVVKVLKILIVGRMMTIEKHVEIVVTVFILSKPLLL